MAWQEDGRRERELAWTEGFGGEECLRRRDHYGEVVWHSLHTGGRIRHRPRRRRRRRARPATAWPPPPAEPLRRLRASLAGADSRAVGAGAHEPTPRPGRAAGRAPSARYRTSVGDLATQLYWGDLHRHSLISRCTAGDEPELDDFYRYSFDVCEYDFWAVTDHAENTSQYQWWSIQKLADVLHVNGRFVPFYGFEWTAATGHQNVIYESSPPRRADLLVRRRRHVDARPACGRISARPGQRSLTIPHHPWLGDGARSTGRTAPTTCSAWSRSSRPAEATTRTTAAFASTPMARSTGTFVADGLRQGHRFGLISSSDHGNGASYVGAFAERAVSRESIFAALHDRRTIAATTRDIVVDFRLNDCFMGAEAPAVAGGHASRSSALGATGTSPGSTSSATGRRPQPRAGARARTRRSGRADAGRVGDGDIAADRLERPLADRPAGEILADDVLVARDHRRRPRARCLDGGHPELPLPVRRPAGRRRGHAARFSGLRGPGHHRGRLRLETTSASSPPPAVGRARPERGAERSRCSRPPGDWPASGGPSTTTSTEPAVTSQLVLRPGHARGRRDGLVVPGLDHSDRERSLPEAGKVGLLELAGLEMEPLAAVGVTQRSPRRRAPLRDQARLGGGESRRRRPTAA